MLLRIVCIYVACLSTLCVSGPSASNEVSLVTRGFSISRGINVYRWLAEPRRVSGPNGPYFWPPFDSVKKRFDETDMRALKGHGFDFVRLPVDPGPFLEFSGEKRDFLYKDLREILNTITQADLSVIVDLHANVSDQKYGPNFLLDPKDPSLFSRYVAFVNEIAEYLSELPSRKVALEIFNEPLVDCKKVQPFEFSYNNLQIVLYHAARKNSPTLPLILTAGCASDPEGLSTLDTSTFKNDTEVYYTFHFYKPYLFTLQGVSSSFQKYVSGLPYPSLDAGESETEVQVKFRRKLFGSNLSSAEKGQLWLKGSSSITDYFKARYNVEYVLGQFGLVNKWASRNGISPGKIILGEFGVERSDENGDAATDRDRNIWLEDVRKTAEKYGFPWAMWLLVGKMGMVNSDKERVAQPALLQALGLSSPGSGTKISK